MKDKFIFCAVFLSCIFASTTFGQTSEQVKEKYGQPIEAYSVSERIWMTPRFTADGQVCAMRLYPKRISSTTNYLSDKLDYWELKEVLNQLAPPETRGKKMPFSGLMNLGGGMITTHYNYEKVGFRFLASFSPYLDPIDIEKSGKTKTKPTKVEQETPKNIESDEEMIVPREVEIVTICWNEKTCGE